MVLLLTLVDWTPPPPKKKKKKKKKKKQILFVNSDDMGD